MIYMYEQLDSNHSTTYGNVCNSIDKKFRHFYPYLITLLLLGEIIYLYSSIIDEQEDI
jgi:hypothetical protein